MSGSANGSFYGTIIGCRIATNNGKSKLYYTPAHIGIDGKRRSARITIPIAVNVYGRKETDYYQLVAWGRRADLFANNLNKGKEMHFPIVEASSFRGQVRDANGNISMGADGQPITTSRVNFIIRAFHWGQDSSKTLMEEIGGRDAQGNIVPGMIASGEGSRPAQWNIPGTPDWQQWKNLLEARKNNFFNSTHWQSGRYGFAQVVAPKNYQKILEGPQYDMDDTPENAAIPETGVVNQPLVNQIANTLTPGATQPMMGAGTSQPMVNTIGQTGVGQPIINQPGQPMINQSAMVPSALNPTMANNDVVPQGITAF